MSLYKTMKQNNMKPKAKAESALLHLEEIQTDKKKRSFPYRGYHPKKESSSNIRNWMELYPEPKRQTGQRPTEAQGTLWHDGELF